MENKEKSKKLPPPKGWLVAGSHPAKYDMAIFTDFSHSGKQCAQIRAKEPNIDGFGTLMQTIDACGYTGSRIQLTGFIKSSELVDWAGLWMRVDADSQIVGFDNMQNRAIKGDSDWTQYSVVLDVPDNSSKISFGALLSGSGCIWLDDFDLKIVGQDLAPTDTSWQYRSCGISYQNIEPTNLDFKQGLRPSNSDSAINSAPVGWFKQKSGEGNFELELSDLHDDAEQVAAVLKVDGANWGALLQAVQARQYVGKRIMLSGSIKTDTPKGNATLFLRADAGRQLTVCHDYMEGRELKGTNDWSNHACVIDIPEGSDNIYIGGVLNGDGIAWFKDFTLQEVSKDIATTGKYGGLDKRKTSAKAAQKLDQPMQPTNLDFEGGSYQSKVKAHCMPVGLPIGWIASGSNPKEFKMCIDGSTKYAGSKCAMIKALKETAEFGTLMQMVNADFALGKNMRLSAHIKSENAGSAALWMRIDGANGEILGFDNMQGNPITDTTDWNYYECVLHVPLTAKSIAFGVLLGGKGSIWISKVALEQAPDDAEITGTISAAQAQQVPINMSFEEG